VCGYILQQILGCLNGVGGTCNIQGFGGRIRRRLLREPACRPTLADMKLHPKKIGMKGHRLILLPQSSRSFIVGAAASSVGVSVHR